MSIFFMILGLAACPPFVEIVKNPKEPGPHVLSFEEDLRFGGDEEEEHYLWVDGLSPADFAIAPNGHFFVVDLKNSRILEFDSKGVFVRVFADQGEGPGEYQNLLAFSILKDGRAIGFDSQQATSKFTYYDKSLNYQHRKIRSDSSDIIVRPFFSPDGRHMFCLYSNYHQETKTLMFKTGLFNQDYELIKEFSRQEYPLPDRTRLDDREMWTDFFGKQLKSILNQGSVSASFLADNTILVSDSKTHEIQHWNAELTQHLKTYQKEFDAVAYTKSDYEALADYLEEIIFAQGGQEFSNLVNRKAIYRSIEKAKLPLRKDPLLAIISMEHNQFLGIFDFDFAKGTFRANIFAENGKCIGQMESPGKGIHSMFGTRMLFRNNFAYTMERNDDGDNQLVRYRYKLIKKEKGP